MDVMDVVLYSYPIGFSLSYWILPIHESSRRNRILEA
jgi:hypothetical protein